MGLLDFQDPAPQGQVTTGFASRHMKADRKFREDNAGLGYASPDGLLAGAYINSLDKPSVYVAKEFSTDPLKLGPVDLRAAITAGLVTGYNKSVMPLLMPGVTGTVDGNTLALGYVPAVRGVTPATFALQLRKKF